jgi:hypothetical protein
MLRAALRVPLRLGVLRIPKMIAENALGVSTTLPTESESRKLRPTLE